MKTLPKCWGYVLFVILVTGVYYGWLSSLGITVLSAATVFYTMFQAPMVCAVKNSTGRSPYCRNNASGLLVGCWIRQHKWQKFKLMFIPEYWRRIGREFYTNPVEGLKISAAVLGGIGGVLGTTVGLITVLH